HLTRLCAVEGWGARIRALHRRGHALRGRVLRVADLALDPAGRAVTRGEQTVELTTREYPLLHLLMRHPGQILSRVTIEERVWGYDSEAGSNVVDAYIRLLRRKVDAGYTKRLIQTIRGVGYVLKA